MSRSYKKDVHGLYPDPGRPGTRKYWRRHLHHWVRMWERQGRYSTVRDAGSGWQNEYCSAEYWFDEPRWERK